MRRDGSQPFQAEASADYLSWSPNGKLIAVTAIETSYARQIRVSDAHELRDSRQVGAAAGEPSSFQGFSWSPDGTQIAFCAANDVRGIDVWNLWTVNVVTGALRRLTRYTVDDDEINGGSPSWSPDGREIAYGVLPDGKHGYIEIVSPSGKHLGQIDLDRIFHHHRVVPLTVAWRP